MVLQGQYLERATIVRAGELALEALYHRGAQRPAALLVPPSLALVFAGSPMELPVVAELAWALHRLDQPTLRYNPRGLGASQGSPGGEAGALEDASAALGLLVETVGESRAVVVGVGEGAAAALGLAGDPRAAGVVLLAPPRRLLPRPIPDFARVLVPEGPEWDDLPPESRLERLAGVDAQFLRGLPLAGRRVAELVSELG